MADRHHLPPHQVWLLEPPQWGAYSTTVLYSEHAVTEAQPLLNAGWVLTGPYVLSAKEQTESAREYLATLDTIEEKRRHIH